MEKSEEQTHVDEQKKEEAVDIVDATNAEKKKKKKKKKKAATGEQADENKQADDAETNEQEDEKDEKDVQEGADGDKDAKKKKKKKKPKAKAPTGFDYKAHAEKHKLMYEIDADALKNFENEQDNSRLVNLKSWKAGKSTQTTPPTLTIDAQYPSNDALPTGLIVPYDGPLGVRFADEKFAMQDEFMKEKIYCLRRSAEVHRQVRKHCQRTIKPGQRMVDICHNIERTLAYILDSNGIERGQAFPTGCSLNNVAAHYTPNYGDETVLGADDVCKIDFGTHVNGYLIDSAFTVAFNPRYNPLLVAVQEATAIGVKTAGVDVRLSDVGDAIQEVMESHEVELNGKIYPVLCVRNLCGHTIAQYRVHAGKSVPIVRGGPQTKMEEGEIYAIETFGSTGKGFVREDMECSHYMKAFDAVKAPLKHPKSKKLLSTIERNFSTLAWCRRWLDDLGETGYLVALKELVDKGVVSDYPPLCDVSGSYVAQYEHTLLLKPSGKEIMSIGDDY